MPDPLPLRLLKHAEEDVSFQILVDGFIGPIRWIPAGRSLNSKGNIRWGTRSKEFSSLDEKLLLKQMVRVLYRHPARWFQIDRRALKSTVFMQLAPTPSYSTPSGFPSSGPQANCSKY